MKILFLYQGKTSDPSFQGSKLPLFRRMEDIEFKIVVLEDDLKVKSDHIDVVTENESGLAKYFLEAFGKSLNEEFDLVHTLKPGTSLLSFLISRIKNKPLVLGVDDYDWTKNFAYRKSAEFLLKKSNHEGLITASKALTEWLDGEHISNTADLEEFDKRKYENFRRKMRDRLDLKGFQVLLWAGIFVPQVNIDFLTELVKELGKKQKLLIIGGGEKLPMFKKKIKNLNEEKVLLTGWIDREEIPKYYSLGDIGIFPFPNTPYHRCKCPIKLFEYMATGIPVFTTPVGEPKHMVKKAKCGEICKSPSHLAQKASTYDRRELEEMGSKGRKHLEENLNVGTQADKLRKIYSKTLEGTR